MTVNYTTLLGLAQPVSGTEAGTWGDTVNNNLTAYLDDAIAGAQIISGTLTAVTLSKTTGSSLSQAGTGATGSSQYQIIRCTGAPASLLTITVPAANKTYVVINATSTSQSVKIVGAGPTTGVTITSGKTSIVSWNGSDFVEITPSTISGTLPVANGGTGNTTGTATINANLTGAITSIGNAASLGSFTSANLAAALTDKTGTGTNVFASNPTFPAQISLTANSGYNIYASGTAPNYFGANVGIGTGSILPQISLYNTRNITGNSESYASYIQATVQTDVTSAGFGSRIALSAAAAASIPALYNIYINQGTFGAGSAVTNQYGVLVESTLTGATNNYGFYGNIASGTGRYNLYMGGSADNYLAGNLGVGGIPVSSITALGAGQSTASFNTSTGLGGALIVGDTSSAGGNGGAIVFSAASTAWRFAAIKGMATNGSSNSQGDLVFSVRPVATDSTLTESFRLLASKNATFAGSVGIGTAVSAGTNLIVNKNSTGATTTYSVDNQFTIQSDVTTLATGFRSVALTQEASFTLANLVHFGTTQVAFGAGSSVTNQYGFNADGSLTGATNNYGFYGGIASGTGRYNLYMGGTADNYLAGTLGIGAINASYKLNVDNSANSNIARFYQSGASLNTDIYIDNVGSANNFLISRRSNGESWFYNSGTNPFVFYTNAAERLRIDSTGNVGIGTASPNASAILDVQSTTKGVRMPNMTTTQKNAISSPAAGLMVFDTNLAKLCVYSGAAWQTITSI
jgi:hypothetical protein